MSVISVSVGGLVIHDGIKYAVSAETLTMLEAAEPQDAIMVDMARRPPAYIRSQIQARPVTLGVYFLRTYAPDRKTDYDALLAALSNAGGLIPLEWTDGAVTKQLLVHRSNLVPSTWFSRAEAELVAPDPIAVVV